MQDYATELQKTLPQFLIDSVLLWVSQVRRVHIVPIFQAFISRRNIFPYYLRKIQTKNVFMGKCSFVLLLH